MSLKFSIIVPVYNRPNEIEELLESLTKQSFDDDFEVIIIEDGSTDSSKNIVDSYSNKLNLAYYYKQNSGAGESRNFGMQKATGDYFIILDSDVIVPKHYLNSVSIALELKYTDAFGGADAAHDSFTDIQKAINYSMTSVLTTGGIRGKKKSVGKFQPRSFNMGISKSAFKKTQGFSKMRVGEDIDLTFRLWNNDFETQFILDAFVYHKRRTSLKQFSKQVYAFGTARPVLNRKYPKTAKITYWFPTLFSLGFLSSIVFLLFGLVYFFLFYIIYLFGIFIDSLLQNKNIKVALLSIITSVIQFFTYGYGFIKSIFINKNNC